MPGWRADVLHSARSQGCCRPPAARIATRSPSGAGAWLSGACAAALAGVRRSSGGRSCVASGAACAMPGARAAAAQHGGREAVAIAIRVPKSTRHTDARVQQAQREDAARDVAAAQRMKRRRTGWQAWARYKRSCRAAPVSWREISRTPVAEDRLRAQPAARPALCDDCAPIALPAPPHVFLPLSSAAVAPRASAYGRHSSA